MKNTSKRKCSMRMADGGVLPVRPVSPYSLLGIGRNLASAYDAARGGVADGFEALHHKFGTPVGYTPAVVAPPPAAPEVQANSVPQLGGLNLDVIQRREAAAMQGLRDGTGLVRGPGGPTEDKVKAELSNGESVLPADTTAIVGPENIQRLIDETHTPAHLQRKGVPPGGRHGLRFANGIAGLEVSETPFTESDAKLFNQRPAGTVQAPNPKIPGIEVHEPFAPQGMRAGPQPSIPGMQVSYGVQDPGPGNPNVRTMGPNRPPVTAAPAAPAAVPEPAPVAAVTPGAGGGAARAGELAYRGGRAVAAGLRAAGPMLAAGEVAANLGGHRVSDDLAPVDSSLSGMVGYMRKGQWGNAYDSFAKGAVEAGMDLAHSAAGIGDTFLPGTPLEDRLNARIQSDLGVNGVSNVPFKERMAGPGGQPAPTAAAAKTAAVNPTDQRLQDGTQVAPSGMRSASVTNAPGVRKFTDDTGRVTYTNVDGGQDFGSNTGSPSAQNIGAAQALSDKYGAAARGGLRDGTGSPGGFTVLGPSGGPDLRDPAYLAERAHQMDVQAGMKGMSNRQRAALMQSQEGNQTQRDIATMNNATSRENTARTVGATLRGQDLSYDSSMLGHQLTAANARARLQYDMGKDNRDYGLRTAEFGQKRSEAAFAQSQKASEELQKNLEARFRTTDAKGNNVPDAGKIADYRTAVQATVPALVQQLEASGNPQAIAKAQDLRQRGVAALEPDDHQRLQQLFDMRDRMAQAKGIGPNQGTYAHSDNLLDYQQLPGAAGVEHRTFGANRVVTPAGSISAKDLRYSEGPANAFLPDFDFMRTRERNLTRGLRTE